MNRLSAATRAALLMVCIGGLVGSAEAQNVPEPWRAQDVGTPALTSSSSLATVLRVDAAGAGIDGESDQFHFVYQVISGDVDLRAKVDSVMMANDWSKAGLMIRASLAQRAAHGSVFVSAARGSLFQRRNAQSGTTASTVRSNLGPPRWIRLTRAGSQITGYTSTDGVNWSAVASDTVALGTTAYVGIAVSSHNPNVRTSARVSNITFVPPAPPVEPLPAGQTAADIGGPGVAGSVEHASGRYTILASGADIWDTYDQFHFVYQPVAGDAEVIARVASIAPVDPWSKAGVMVRESLAPGSRHGLVATSAGKGYAFQRRVETDAWSEHTSGGSGTPPGWVRLVRKGDTLSAYRSADGKTWTSIGSDTVPMSETVLVGIAVTSHVNDVATTAVVDSLRITSLPAAPANKPPAVLLSAPANGATYTAPASVTLTASATDPDGSVSAVEFYANGTLLGRDTSAPYSVTGSLGQGSYTFTAVATDSDGASTISAPVSITVKAAPAPDPDPNPVPEGDDPRLVMFTASADHHTLVIKYVLEVYSAGATPGVSKPVSVSDLGKPEPMSNGDVIVDRAAFFQALARGNYIAAVVAVGQSSTARSVSVSFTR